MKECSKSFYNDKIPLSIKGLREHQIPQGAYFVRIHTPVWNIMKKVIAPGGVPFNISIRCYESIKEDLMLTMKTSHTYCKFWCKFFQDWVSG
eukprot:15360244-Ditylum_brightwellii.AAC.1